MRLIDADETIINFGFEWDDISPTRDEFVAFLKKQPTIDAVPVVRCKDCKHLYDEMDDYCCMSHMGLVKICENSFCSYGERKDGAD